MSEPENIDVTPETDDAEGHSFRGGVIGKEATAGEASEDVEGHRFSGNIVADDSENATTDGEDVEGHRYSGFVIGEEPAGKEAAAGDDASDDVEGHRIKLI